MPRTLRCFLESYTWKERFRFASHETADSMVRAYQQEATRLFEDFSDYTRTADVQVTSWSVDHNKLGVNIQRITIRVDRSEAGFRRAKKDILNAWINFEHLHEPLDLLREACRNMWVIRQWGQEFNSYLNTREPNGIPASNSIRWKPLHKLVKLP